MMDRFFDLDFSQLEDIPAHLSRYTTPQTTVSEKGMVSLNSVMLKTVGSQRMFRARLSPNGYWLVLYRQGEPNLRFSAKSGHASHPELAQLLREKGFSLPAAYTMEWCQEEEAWVGRCQEMAPPPALSLLEPPSKPQRKPRRRRGAGGPSARPAPFGGRARLPSLGTPVWKRWTFPKRMKSCASVPGPRSCPFSGRTLARSPFPIPAAGHGPTPASSRR